MSKNKSDLSITKRILIDYIVYKTRHNFKFFGDNEYIGKCLSLTTGTTKTLVNDLIRNGYLYKEIDRNGRRMLSYTGKEYQPLFEDMSNIDKKYLKVECEDYKRNNNYLDTQLKLSEGHVEQLLTEKTQLVLTNSQLSNAVYKLQEEVKALKERIKKLEERVHRTENLKD